MVQQAVLLVREMKSAWNKYYSHLTGKQTEAPKD